MTEQAKEFIKKRYLSSEDERRGKEEMEPSDQNEQKLLAQTP